MHPQFPHKLMALALASCFSAGASGNPVGPAVAIGNASVQRAGNTLNITNTPGTVINWQGFSIGANEVTRFIQSGPESAVLNRVIGGDPSNILGQLLSNGRVFLLNPNGVFIGGGAVIDVGGFIASTLKLSDADFLAGRFKFDDIAGAGRIVNQGTIRTPEHGKVFLIAPDIENNGLITSPSGEITLAAGRKVELVNAASPDVRVELSAPEDKAVNVGQLIAASGAVGIFGTTVRNAGTISANSARLGENGRIALVARGITLEAGSKTTANGTSGGLVRIDAGNGTLEAAGEISAIGSAGKGGEIVLTGQRVGLFQQARVDASGERGGGMVLVRGDYQGANPEVGNAKLTVIGPQVEIRADALDAGKGGKVVVWADDTTRYHGSISARGGPQGGDGGMVEVSGKDTLSYKGRVDTRAPLGRTGSLLLDPANIVITNGSGDSTDDGADVSTTSFAGNPSGVTGSVSSGDNPGGGTLTLFESELEGIAAGTNLTLAATNAITINNLADDNLNLAQTGGGSVSFSSASFNMHASDIITTAGAAINITTSGSTTAGGLNAAGGAITLNTGGTSSVSGTIAGSGTTLEKLGAGTLTLGGTNTHTGTTTVSAGTLTLTGGAAIANNAAVNLGTSGAVLNVVNAEVLGSLSGVAGTTVNLNTATLTTGDAGNATFAGLIQGAGNLVKNGSGAWTLSGSNTFTGLTTINAGTLKLGAAGDASNTPLGTVANGTLVRPGATLDLNGYSLGTAEALAINGTGAASAGALTNSAAGAASYSGLVTLGMASSITSSAGDISLTHPGPITGNGFALTLGGSGNGTMSSIIGTGAGTVTKEGAGTWTLSALNTYTGATTVNAGTLRFGTNSAIAGSATTVNNGGTLDLNNFSGTIGALAVNSGVTGGQVTTGTGTLTLGGDITSTGGSATASISGNLNLGGVTRNITTTNAADGLGISAVISGTAGITKAGAGTVTLSGANSYTGLTTISAGTLKLGAAGDATNTPLGTVLSGTTVASGAVLDLNGYSLGAAEPLTLAGTGIASSGALSNSGGAATYSGLVTLSSAALIKAGAGDINLSNTGAITGAGLGLTLDGTANGSIAGNIATVTGSLTKNGTGTWTLTGNSNFSGATAINSGVLSFSGADGGNSGQSAYTVSAGGTLKLDNSGANNSARINDGSNLTMTGGELLVTGNASTNTSESLGVLTLSTGHSTVTLNPDAARNTRLNFGSLTRTAGATGLFRGTQLGNSTVAAQTAGESNITFTAAPALTGSGGNAGTTTVSILNASIGAGGAGGTSNSGSDFLTYDPPTGTLNGLRPLTAGEYAATPATGVNLKLSSSRVGNDSVSVNSLLLSGGINYDFNTSGGADTLTVTSGNILSAGGSNSIQNTLNTGALAFGTTEAKMFAVSGLTLGSNTPITGTGGLTMSGTGTLLENRATALTGGITVNQGTLRSGIASAFASQALTVRSPATFDLNGNNQTVSGTTSLTLDAGTTGASILGAGTLTVGGNIAVNVNGAGATGASIASNLALAAAPTITVTDGATANDLTISSVISGAATSLSTAGTGTLLLSGENTHTGSTLITAGTLKLGAAGNGTNTPLGTVAGATSITANAALDLNGFTLSTAEPLTISGTGVSSGGALTNSSGSAVSYSGLLTLGAAASVVANAGDINLTHAGTITGATFGLTLGGSGNGSLASILGTTSGTLTKAGTGTWTVSGASTYTGLTSIGAGTLKLGAASGATNTPLGTVAAGTSITAGAALDLNGFTLGTNEALTLNGTGINNGGALTNSSGTAANYTGLVTLGSASSILTNAGNINLTNTGTTLGAGFGLTLGGSGNGSIAGIIGTTTGGLTKNGSGTWTLSGANTYTGTTTINAGTLQYGASNAISTGAVTVNDGGALNLAGFSDSVGAITVNGGNTGGSITTGAGTLTTTGTVTSAGGSNASIAGNLAMPAAASITVTNAGDTLSIPAIISGAGTSLSKTGTGTLVMAGANTYVGSTLVTLGTLKLGATGDASNTPLGTTALGTTVSNGAVLDLNGQTLGTAEALTLNGTGINASGALTNSSATAGNYSGLLSLASASQVETNAGAINLTHTGTISGATFGLTLDGTGNGSIASIIGTTSGTVIKNGTGSWTLSGANTYTGATSINAGVLRAQNSNAVGTSAGGLTIASGAALELDSVAGITIADAITVNGTGISAAGAIRNIAGSNSLTGGITLGSATRVNSDAGTLTVATGGVGGAGQSLTAGGNGSITISSAIATTSGTLTKDGTGTLTLSGTNTYTGATAINAGVLRAENNAALGTAAGGTTVASSAALELNGGTLTVAEAVTINGTGIANAGAIRNVAGTNSITGGLTLGSAARINSDAGSLTISTTGIGGATLGLTAGGAGDLTISSNITTTSGTLTKDGLGTLILSGTNTYTGATAINAGILRAQSNAALGTAAGGTTIAADAALEISGSGLSLAESLNIAGTGISSGGAVRNLANNNTLTGGLVLSSAARINSDAGTLSISTGGISGAFNLTAGGSGNVTVNSAITTGTGGVSKDGTGTLTLANAGNSFTGALTLNRGTTSVTTLANSGANSAAGAGSSIVLGSADAANLTYTGTSTSINRSLTIGGAGGGTLQASGSSQTLTLSGAVAGTAGPLTIAAGTNNIALTGTSNTLGTVAITSGNDISLRSANLTLGASTVSGTLDARGTGNVTVSATQTVTGAVTIVADGTLALNGSINTSAGGNAITLAGNTVFTRDAGANLSMGGGGRWVIYSADPDQNTFNGLASGNSAVWTKTFAVNPPSGIASGNRYVFSATPTLTYTSTNLSKTYGDDASASLPAAYSISGLRGDYGGVMTADTLGSVVTGSPSLTSAGSAASANVAGSPYTINIATGTLAASSGYALAYNSAGQLTVNKAALTATADDKSKTYGGSDPTLSYTVNATQLKNGDTAAVVSGVNLSAPTAAAATAGTHTITATGGTASNYTVTAGNGTLTVAKAALTATADDKSKTYGGTDPTLSYSVGGTLFYGDTAAVVSGVNLSAPTAAAATAGTHTITATGSTASNYTVTAGDGTLTVAKAALTATADDKSKTYGGTDPSLTYSVGGTLFYGDTTAVASGVNLSAPTAAAATAGTHTITATGGSASNYTVTAGNGTLTVAKALLNITADDKTKTYGDAEPALTYRADGLQLKYSDTLSVVSGISLATKTGQAATAGAHVITTSGGTATNYSITTINGQLTVSPATLLVTAENSLRNFGASNPPFKASIAGYQYGEGGTVLGGLLDFNSTASLASQPGAYSIMPTGLAATNYQFTYMAGTLTVLPSVALSVTAASDLGTTSAVSLTNIILAPNTTFATSSVVVAPSSISQLNVLPPSGAGDGNSGPDFISDNTAPASPRAGSRFVANDCRGILQSCTR